MRDSTGCPSEAELTAYFERTLPAAALERIERHLAGCDDCRQRILGLETSRVWRPSGEQPTCDYEAASADEPTAAYDPARVFAARILAPSTASGSLGRLNNYEIYSVLGQGGYGVVFEAHDPVLARRVAIKVLTPDLANQAVSRRRFIREARAAAAINHPNVVTIFGVDESGPFPFLVMEMLRGRSLRERIRRDPKLDLLDILRISVQIAQGLAAAHAQGIVHRDVKPGNVLMVDDAPRVKLTDFGLARVAAENLEATTGAAAAGTPGYMSPEQVRGEELDVRSDLFSLGCVIYTMFSGRSPFHGGSIIDVARRVDGFEPPRLRELDATVPEFMEELVVRLLKKRPDDRFQTATEVVDVLNRHLALLNQTPTDRLPEAVQRQLMESKQQREWRSPLVVAAALIAVAAVGLAAGARFLPQRPDVPTGVALPVEPATRSESVGKGTPPSTPPSTPTAQARVREIPTPAGAIRVDQTGAGDCRSLAEAFARVQPGGAIYVLDDATYAESLTLENAAQWAGVELVAVRGAKLAWAEGSAVLTIQGVPRMKVVGFTIEAPQIQWGISVRGECPGLELRDLTIVKRPNPDGDERGSAAIVLHAGAAGAAAAPIRLENVRIEDANVGVVIGAVSDEEAPVRHVQVEHCHVHGASREHATLLAVLPGCDDLQLRRNIFERGGQGVSVVAHETRTQSKLAFEHNTWFEVANWIVWTGPPATSSGSLRFVENLVVNAERVAPEMQALAAADAQTFQGNVAFNSDRAASTMLAPCATLDRQFPLISLDPRHPQFLQPDFAKLAERADAPATAPGAIDSPPQ